LGCRRKVGEGFDVRLVMDASGNDSPTVLQCSIANLTQHGVKVVGWIAAACELQGDWAREDTAKGCWRSIGSITVRGRS
jgi:hypothetical protein